MQTTVVVVPTASGHVGAVVVNPGPAQVVVDEAYEAVNQSPSGELRKGRMTPADVDRIFHDARDAKPTVTYVVHFALGSVDLTAASKKTLSALIADLPALHPTAITVSGHTDRTGDDVGNLDLSEKRSEVVADWLIAHGAARQLVKTYWQGQRQPVKPTAEGKYEPLNRRVEIDVQR